MPSESGWNGWRWLPLLAVVGLVGCITQSTPPPEPALTFRGLTVTVAAIGEPAILATIAAQRGEWGASRLADVEIKGAVDLRSLQGIDVLVFPGDRLGDLVDAGALAALPEALVSPPAPNDEAARGPSEPNSAGADADPLRFAGIAPAFRDQVARYGGDRMALPYGGTALVLVYDRAAFEREPNRAAAQEQSLSLQPPKTWAQLDALARFFQGRDWDGDGATDCGIALPLGTDAEHLADAVFLARSASLGQHLHHYSFLFDAETMAPRIDSPPFVAALEELVKLKACGPPGMERFGAEEARRAFVEQKAAMLIDRAEMAARWAHGKTAIGVAPLPGSERVYSPDRQQWEEVKPLNDPSYLPFGGGWLVGINRATEGKRRDAAIDFARYLISPDIARRVGADREFPMLPVRPALLDLGPGAPALLGGVNPRQWSDAVNRTVVARRVVPGLRIPGSGGYLADLAQGRTAAALGEPAAVALQGVAQAWAERTKELGSARQTWHYRCSLNSFATLPEPPER